jgi:hypothetical protein
MVTRGGMSHNVVLPNFYLFPIPRIPSEVGREDGEGGLEEAPNLRAG